MKEGERVEDEKIVTEEKKTVSSGFMMAGKAALKEPEVPEMDEHDLLLSTKRSIGGIFGDSETLFSDREADDVAAAEAEAAEVAAAKAAEEAAAKEQAKKPVRVTRAKSEIERPAAPAPTPPPAPERKAELPDLDPLTGLTRAEMQELDKMSADARDSVLFLMKAATVDTKYSGFAKRQYDFVKAHAAKRAEIDEDDEDAVETLDRWVAKNKPVIEASEARALERKVLKEDIKREAKEEMSQELSELKKWKQRQELEKTELPKVHREIMESRDALRTSWLKNEDLKEVIEFFDAKVAEGVDPAEARKQTVDEYPMESEVIFDHSTAAQALTHDLLMLRRGMMDYDENNSVHKTLAERVVAYEDRMANSPALKSQRVRAGKTFLSAREFHALSPDKRDKHWTFSDQDLIGYIRREAELKSAAQVKEIREKQRKAFERFQGRASAKTTPEKKDAKEEEAAAAAATQERSPRSRQPGRQELEKAARSNRLVNWDFEDGSKKETRQRM